VLFAIAILPRAARRAYLRRLAETGHGLVALAAADAPRLPISTTGNASATGDLSGGDAAGGINELAWPADGPYPRKLGTPGNGNAGNVAGLPVASAPFPPPDTQRATAIRHTELKSLAALAAADAPCPPKLCNEAMPWPTGNASAAESSKACARVDSKIEAACALLDYARERGLSLAGGRGGICRGLAGGLRFWI
jgi:hypothetical protein